MSNVNNELSVFLNNTNYPIEKTVSDMIYTISELYKDCIALSYKGKSITYDQLNKKSNQLARVLRKDEINSNCFVAIYTEHSIEMIISILAVIKAGGTYIPINTKDSYERQKHILTDSKSNFILTNQKETIVNKLIENTNVKKVYNILDEKLYLESCENLENINNSTDLLYVIYTSGTTGVPKGVKITHTNLISLFFNEKFPFNFSCEDVWTLFHTYCFDFSAWEIFGALFFGGKLVILSEEERKVEEKFFNALIKNKVTILSLVPSVFYSFLDCELEWNKISLKYLFFGGESLNPRKLQDVKQYFVNTYIFNLYGITETTIFNLYKLISNDEIEKGISNIGKPLPMNNVYVLNNDKLCEIGEVGELCISGTLVGNGYLNLEKLTNQKFIENPFCTGEILYKTGDTVRMHRDKNIEYIGRIDNQVKVRGFRIELEEIENCIKQFPEISNAVIKPYQKQNSDDTILLGYVAFKFKKEKDKQLDRLKYFLNRKLPSYMIPTLWVVLDKIPVTLNGKVNRNNLPQPSFSVNKNKELKFENKTQEKLYRLWENLFGYSDFDINTSFFELGGHSLLAIKARNLICKEFNVDILMSEFMANPTVFDISKIIDNKNSKEKDINNNFRINLSNKYECFEMTDLQQAYYIGRQSDISLGNCATHIYAEIRCKSYNHDKFLDVVEKLIVRHDMLRCVFDDNGNQHILKDIGKVKVPLKDISKYSLEKKNEYLYKLRKKLENQILDYRKAPLATLNITIINDGEAIIHLYHDAMIVDGWSHEMLLSEADTLYQDINSKLPDINISFKNYVEYCNHIKCTDLYNSSKSFWKEQIKTLPDNPELPLIEDPQNLKEITSIQIKKMFTFDEWHEIECAAEFMKVSTFVLSLTAFCKSIARYSNKQSFIINIPVSYRPEFHEDIDKIVGVCSNYFLFDFNNLKDISFAECAQKVQKRLWELNDNNSFTGTEVVRELYKTNGKIGDNIATIVFTSLIDVPYKPRKFLKREFIETHTSQIWIDSVAFKMDDHVTFNWDCVEGLFDKYVLNKMADYFKNIMQLLVGDIRAWNNYKSIALDIEDKKIIDSVNNSKSRIENKTINEKFLESYNKFSKKVSICTIEKTYTYKELFEESQRISYLLKEAGVKSGDGVAILMNKSFHQIASVISILSIGAFYMPLDIDMPDSYINYCLKNSNINVVITNTNSKEKNINNSVINIDDKLDCKIKESYNPIKDNINNLMCIIYTSGSTGRPKGIKINQLGLINAVNFTNNEFCVNENDKAIALTNLCHDMSMYDIFGMLFSGGSIVIPNHRELKDPLHWVELINKYEVTIWNSVPSFMKMLYECKLDEPNFSIPSLRLIIHGGDFLKPSIAGWVKKITNKSELINVGGPTETTLWSIYHRVTDQDIKNNRIPYGKAIQNMSHYILNENLELCPLGVKGTIFSSGVGVSDGYINLEEENKKRFIEWNNKRLFNTGDVGFYLKNGEIQIVGRDDNQIKINGKRIEIEGIENILSSYMDIKSCVVKLSSTGDYLIAYYLSKINYTNQELELAVTNKLPLYMLPKYFIRVDKMPVTLSGKIDRKALPSEYIEEEIDIKIELRDDLDLELSEYCCELLSRNKILINDNFFIIGGNSISAIKMLAFIKKNYMVDIKLADMLSNPTIECWHDLILDEILKDDKVIL